MKKIALSTAAMLAVAFVIVISSCSKGGSANSKKTDAKILFIHTAVNTSSLDFYLDTAKENTTPIAYASITSYQDITAGSYTFKANIDSTGSTVVDTLLNFASSADYSVFVVDTAPNLSVLVLNDTTATPPSGSAYIRFVDLVPNSPVYNIGMQGGSILANNIGFEGYSGFQSVTAGSVSVQLILSSNNTVATTFPAITLSSGKIYTFAFAGLNGSGLNDLLIGNL